MTQSLFPTYLKSHEMDSEYLTPEGGLTERRLFAAMAMQGVLSSLSTSFSPHAQPYEEINAIAKAAVKLADALIEELDKPVSAEQPPGETL